jgi:hypothetical protein
MADDLRAEGRERMERRLRDDLERLRVIREDVPKHKREQEWHRQHTDRLKREVDDLARKLDK